jgi:uncharacterized protein
LPLRSKIGEDLFTKRAFSQSPSANAKRYKTIFRDSHILKLGDATVLVECGPMRMFIEGSEAGVPGPDLCSQAAERAIGFLEEAAKVWPLFRAPYGKIEPPEQPLAHEMWRAVSLVGDPDLTPMAAVAGTIADATADFLADLGLTRVVVNNGGDVAVRLREPESLSVGLRPDVSTNDITHVARIDTGMNIGGICTSGLGGRSFSRGVASSATVFASRASVADAAATAVANATYIYSPAVKRVPADTLDPDTDLKGADVTVSVGDLDPREIEQALSQGIARAEELVAAGIVFGACVAVKDRMACTLGMANLVRPL